MTEQNENEDRISKFLLLNKSTESKPVAVKGRYWIAENIYLNEICLAIWATPSEKIKERTINSEEAINGIIKEELYNMLKGISQLAAEHDLLRPVACVMSEEDLIKSASLNDKEIKQIKRWGSDQDWHRGAFTLYVESKNGSQDEPKNENGYCESVKERLSDLLAPIIETINIGEKSKIKTGDEIADDFKKACREKYGSEKVAIRKAATSLGEALAEGFKQVSDVSEGIKYRLKKWEEDILKQARLIKEGES